MAKFYGDGSYTFTDSGDKYRVIGKALGNQGNEVVKLDDGSTINVYRGGDSDLQTIQSTQYEMKNGISFQLEQDAMSNTIKQIHPDGVGYTKDMQKYLIDRGQEIIDNAPDEVTRNRLSESLNNTIQAGIMQAHQEEQTMSKMALLNTFQQSKFDLLDEVSKNPDNLEVYRLEMADRISRTSEALGWDPKDVKQEITDSINALDRTAIRAQIGKNPSEALNIIEGGYYDNVLSPEEKQGMMELAYQMEVQDSKFEELPSIPEMVKSARTMVYKGDNIEDKLNAGEISPVEFEIANDLKLIENQRLKDPGYRHVKELLTTSKIPGVRPEEEQYGQERLQNLYDSGKLNEQSIDIIHKEIKDKVIARINKNLEDAQFFPQNIAQIQTDQIDDYKKRIRDAYNNKQIDLKTAREQGRLLKQVYEVLQ